MVMNTLYLMKLMQNDYEKIAGTYWLCRPDGKNGLWLTNGEKPIRTSLNSYMRPLNPKIKHWWLRIEDEEGKADCVLYGNSEIPFTKELIEGLRFPKVTWEDGPLEIEITKSGKVYWYES